MEITMRRVSELTPYEKNAKQHDQKQIANVANSIRRFGWQQPIVVDENGVVVIGHCRLLAAKKLGMKEVPVTVASGLTQDEIRELRIADNKTNESPWDLNLLAEDIEGLDFEGFDFSLDVEADSDWFEQREKWDDSTDGESDEYKQFVEKFEAKKTTDDCYTPDNIYQAVSDWVAKEYGVHPSSFVRPFCPGGDYQNHVYPDGCVVVDNPPFSILAEILNFYLERKIRFFLFAPALTLFSSSSLDVSYLAVGAAITYENKASISTSFVTNLDSVQLRSAPELYQALNEAEKENRAALSKELPKYSYPYHVVTSAAVQKYSRYGVEYQLPKGEGVLISELDAQKEAGKSIFGRGFLVSEQNACLRLQAEKAVAEKAAVICWQLSDREKDIIRNLVQG